MLKINIDSTSSDIMKGLNECAPALLATARGADDHQGRMSAMASIAVPLHSRKHPGKVEDVESVEIGVFNK